jgi:hypothetical protein
MKKFKVLIQGKNYLMREPGNSPRKFGFYTTALVEARTAERAKAAAVILLQNDSELADACENDASDPPVIEIESVEEVLSFDGCTLPRTGLALFEQST